MKILLSVFACAPNTGSETGVGWRWAIELARAGHEVVALTDETRRERIEDELRVRPVPNLSVEFYRPYWLRAVPLNSKTAQMLFSAWQYSLLPFAKKLHRRHQFDAVVHLTYGVFRTPCFLGGLGIPLVFGPVGGGEDAPWALKRGLPWSELAKEALRTAMIKFARLNPMLKVSLRSAALILAKTKDTKAALPRGHAARAIVFHEIGIHPPSDDTPWAPRARAQDDPLHLLFAGRLLGWKGVHLAIQALAIARQQGSNVKLTVVGSGPLAHWLHALAKRLGVDGSVEWREHIAQEELFRLYRDMHGLLFPSLHDSSGNVVLEAMSFGLPVICLNLGGPASLVAADCAYAVSAIDGSQAVVVNRLATAIKLFMDDESARQAMSRAARNRAHQMTWASRATGVVNLLNSLQSSHTSAGS